MRAKIGFPATLTYYSYFPFWKAFFEELGMQVVTSNPTSKSTLDAGVRETVTDACVPIKLFHGHVMSLRDRVDFLFIPRMVSVGDKSTFCPKFLGLPEMIRYTLDRLPPLIDIRVDLMKGRGELFRVCQAIGKTLNTGWSTATRAYHKAIRQHRLYQKLLLDRYLPYQAMARLFGEDEPAPASSHHDLNLAVLGYPYQVHDNYINVNLLGILDKLGANVWTTEMVPPKLLRRHIKCLPKRLFWHYSNQVVWAAHHYLEQDFVDGIIHVTAFGCGPDAMVDKIMELDSRQRGRVPFMSLTIDEHTGQAGMLTRLEAFVDMIRLRRDTA